VDLRLDDHGAAQAARDLGGFLRGEGDFASGDGNVMAGEDALGLMLVDFHKCSWIRVKTEKKSRFRARTRSNRKRRAPAASSALARAFHR
jgi:hypothetical protein